LIIRFIVQTIGRDRSGAVWIDASSDVSRPDPSGADQIDVEHEPTDLMLGLFLGHGLVLHCRCSADLPCEVDLVAVEDWEWPASLLASGNRGGREPHGALAGAEQPRQVAGARVLRRWQRAQGWSITRYRDQIQEGDDVALWLAGHDAGVVALGVVTGEVEDVPGVAAPYWTDPADAQAVRMWMPLRLTEVFLDAPITGSTPPSVESGLAVLRSGEFAT
jgi:hypothetical protein